MVEYTKVNVKSSDSQIKELKDAVKDNTGTTLRKVWKCLMVMIYHMNYYSQKDEKQN